MEGDTPAEGLNLYQGKNKKPKRKKQTKLPSNALALYIKLYCSKKCAKSTKYSTNVIEATKSWITLCDKEKEQFYNKYKECQRKHMQIISNCLQKAEPYMKKKISKGLQKKDVHETNIGQEPEIINTDENEVKLETNMVHDHYIDRTEHTSAIDENYRSYNEMDQTTMESHIDNNQIYQTHESSNIFYAEPTPPNIRTGKELFEIIKLIDKTCDATWASQSTKEKFQHNRAVLTLKQDYINKYKQYLEHLTQKELFDHYNKIIH